MTPLAIKGTEVELRKNQNQRVTSDKNPDLSLAYVTANIVVPITNIDSVLLMAKYVRHVVKGTILPKSVGLGKAKAKVKAQVVQGTSHLNTEK